MNVSFNFCVKYPISTRQISYVNANFVGIVAEMGAIKRHPQTLLKNVGSGRYAPLTCNLSKHGGTGQQAAPRANLCHITPKTTFGALLAAQALPHHSIISVYPANFHLKGAHMIFFYGYDRVTAVTAEGRPSQKSANSTMSPIALRTQHATRVWRPKNV